MKYNVVYQLKENFPTDEIIINGGITSTSQIKFFNHLKKVDGVMLGSSHLCLSLNLHICFLILSFFPKKFLIMMSVPSRQEVIEQLVPYVKKETKKGTRLNQIMRHTLGLFHGQTGSSFWKRYLSENMCVRDADVQKIDHIMDKIKFNNLNRSAG